MPQRLPQLPGENLLRGDGVVELAVPVLRRPLHPRESLAARARAEGCKEGSQAHLNELGEETYNRLVSGCLNWLLVMSPGKPLSVKSIPTVRVLRNQWQ
jgi:hypothetical protein